ncbi:CRISPR-associated protein Cas5, subtype I-B/HMARI [Gottschalkia purinilytica]|uniref:CRISPR-associated protein Cas5, subtype I-B/HMARI n=1 Tax=Gottschalkia purinilytica TaxID=1503 RepID=A0A0L0WA94_GOTPU|nr:type I-B CRISPR-associated protein Cas5b [Gottschalkia purinilytica]KNF08225.1 CRISPR-associated protein Cas5, subtype I-B/HMARI [Gottschalkia purinilytica]
MKAIKFSLSGKFGFFKKPDVNVNTYFTYNNIHKVALLGMLGAIVGLGGHNQKNDKKLLDAESKKKYPEFYEKLKDIKIAIEPLGERGYFTKKIQYFNNSVGYASKEEGGNLVIREQWLEDPAWNIYILDDDFVDRGLFIKIEEFLKNNKCEFIPYLGKNDHIAEIKDVELIELEIEKDPNYISTVFINENINISKRGTYDGKQPYLFKEVSPYTLNEDYGGYEFKEFLYTNSKLKIEENTSDLYKYKDKIISFI